MDQHSYFVKKIKINLKVKCRYELLRTFAVLIKNIGKFQCLPKNVKIDAFNDESYVIINHEMFRKGSMYI